jgi:hypothetical protein
VIRWIEYKRVVAGKPKLERSDEFNAPLRVRFAPQHEHHVEANVDRCDLVAMEIDVPGFWSFREHRDH